MNLKRYRLKAGLTQLELAQLTDLSATYIAMLERGDRKGRNVEILQKIAKALKVKVDQLIEN